MADFLPMFAFIPTILLCCRMSHSLSDSWPPTNTTPQVKYVTPSKSIPCGINGHLNFPCLTIADYANEAETFFVNDSTFLFSPGNHELDITLNLSGIHNMSLKGLSNQRANITISNMLAGILWENCTNIEISNINFNVESNFTYILSFESTFPVKLSNILILGGKNVGCSAIISKRSRVDIFNSKFVKIIGYSGAALIALESVITFAGNNCFYQNTALSGGAMSLHDCSTILLNGYNAFIGNSANYSSYFSEGNGALCTKLIRLNFSDIGLGGAIFCKDSNLTTGDDSIPTKNSKTSASLASGLEYYNSSFSQCFHMNHSKYYSPGNQSMDEMILCSLACNHNNSFSNIMFLDNYAIYRGGALYVQKSAVSFNVVYYSDLIRGNVIFENNSVSLYGGAIHLTGSSLQLCGSVSFIRNKASFGGAIHILASNVSIGMNCCSSATNFGTTHVCKSVSESFNILSDVNCNTTKLNTTYVYKDIIAFCFNIAINRGGAISGSHSSHLYFMGIIHFSNNTADYGGALIVHGTSKLILTPTLTLQFVRNTAKKMGGAIYYHNSVSYCKCSHTVGDGCFLSFYSSLKNISLYFKDNFACFGGAVLYVGNLHKKYNCYGHHRNISIIDSCKVAIVYPHHEHHGGEKFLPTLLKISNLMASNYQSLVFTDPSYIHYCDSSFQWWQTVTVYPGQRFTVILAAFTPADVSINTIITHERTDSIDDDVVLRKSKPYPWVNTSCTNVSYYLLTANFIAKPVHFSLYPDTSCYGSLRGVQLDINVKPCPLGFKLSNEYQECMCDEILQSLTQKCYINTLSVERRKNTFWISKQSSDGEMILHKGGCPFNFCKDVLVNVPDSNPDVQCDFNRSGTLCGQCKKNFSLALGTLYCIKCINSNYIAFVLLFAFAGVVLVVIILILHLTINIGTLNGLIFYANIVHSNHQMFFTYARETTSFCTVFIAWLNLDLGIESCFYYGMDIYAYSWLQFVFPFYIWFLIGAIIFVSRYSKRVSKYLGQNPVAALATLLFVSYGKILNAIITPLSLTHLTLYSSNGSSYTQKVWLYDGGIEYLKDLKHSVLAIFSILTLLVVFLPYTFLLLCGHWLMAYSDKWFLSWLNRIKPFMDVYYAPFKKEARYWIGLILLSRLALLLTIAINNDDSDRVNILVIASVTAGLLFIKGKVYEHNYNDILESSFIFNLCVLSIATFYLKGESPQSQYAVSSVSYAVSTVSIVISFVTFLGILFFHVYLLLKSSSTWQRCKGRLRCKPLPSRDAENVLLGGNDSDVVTTSLVELREPLLDSDDS